MKLRFFILFFAISRLCRGNDTFKGRSTLKQYMPKKPVRRGIKVWMRADAESGYVSAFEVYTGKKGDSVEQGLGSKVVLSLTRSEEQF